jgi:predicted TIM-barrel fold metal-dependent hydrolase
VLERAATYRDWWNDVQQLLAPLDAAGRAAVLGGNACRVYRLGAPDLVGGAGFEPATPAV